MLQKFRMNKKGFTLIELMIVIAIIGILAAIAVPQFLAYRVRSFNSSAKAVAHNAKADQGNLNAELGEYGHTEAAPALLTAATGAAAPADSFANIGLRIAATPLVAGARLAGTHSISARDMSVPIAIGDNMTISAIDAVGNPDSWIIMTRHFRGDTAYGMDADVENVIYSVTNPTWAGLAAGGLQATPVPVTISVDDFGGAAGVPGGGLPTVNWLPSN